MQEDLDEEEMEGVAVDDKMENHQRMGFNQDCGGRDDDKALLHDKRWDLYTRQKTSLIKGGDYVEVSGYDGGEILWEVIDGHVVENPKYNDESVL